MLCKNCGALNDPNSKFCLSCGAELSITNTEEIPVSPESTYNVNNEAPSYPVENSHVGKGLAIASMVLGIVSLFCFAFICGTLGIVFGAVAKNKGYKGGMATAGIICGTIGIVLWVIMLIFGLLII